MSCVRNSLLIRQLTTGCSGRSYAPPLNRSVGRNSFHAVYLSQQGEKMSDELKNNES
jgi:hypothetical protein